MFPLKSYEDADINNEMVLITVNIAAQHTRVLVQTVFPLATARITIALPSIKLKITLDKIKARIQAVGKLMRKYSLNSA